METTLFAWATEQGLPFAMLGLAVWYFWKQTQDLKDDLKEERNARLSEQRDMLEGTFETNKVLDGLVSKITELAADLRRASA